MSDLKGRTRDPNTNRILEGLASTASGLDSRLSDLEGTATEWKAIHNRPFVNVRDYGAKGDGIADDTESIRQAILAQTTLGGGVVFFPPGTYLVTPYVNPTVGGYYAGIWVPGNIILHGSGFRTTTIKLADAATDHAWVIGSWNIGTHTDQYITIRDLTVDGNNTNQGASGSNRGINIWRTRFVTIENVTVKNMLGTAGSGVNEGFHFNATLCTDISYINCIARGTSGERENAFNCNDCSNLKYVNCLAYGMQVSTGTIGTGFTCYGSSQVQYVNCHAFLNKNIDFNAEVSANVSYSGCMAGGESSLVGETPDDTGTHYEVGTNLGNSAYGFVLLDSDYVTILGGVIKHHTTGIAFSTTPDHVTIVGVDVSDNTAALSGTATNLTVIASPGLSNTALVLPGLTVDSPTFVVDDVNNRVGVGIAAPLFLIHAVAPDETNDGYFIDGYGTTGSAGVPSIVARRARDTQASPSAIKADDYMLFFSARGYGATGFSAGSKATVALKAAEDWTDAAQGAYIAFETTTIGGTSRTEKFRIADNGNVSVRQGPLGTGAVGVISVKNGTAPSNGGSDAFQFYAKDIVSGNSAPHFRTENDAIIKLYQQAHIADPTNLATALTAIAAILVALENLGELATS